jgi:hypothetical protein
LVVVETRQCHVFRVIIGDVIIIYPITPLLSWGNDGREMV